MARGLRLNEDLVEAMAMGHDVGHTPFGHIGEELLGKFLPDGFRHNEQSVRIVEKIEKNGAGLNLTKEVRDGIQKHSAPTEGGVETAAWGIPETPEGWVVRYADKIAYLHHDIDDAMRAEIVREEDIPQEIRASLGRDRAERLDTMIYDVIVTSYGKPEVTMSDEVLEATNALRKFMFENVYLAGPAKTEDRKAQGVLWELLQHFEKHPDLLPPEHQRIAQRDSVKRAVADYVAGPNHILPTGGTARFHSALSLDAYVRKSNIVSYTKDDLFKAKDHIVRLAQMEGFDAHAQSVEARLK